MERAPEKGEVMSKYHKVERISFDKERLLLNVEGKEYSLPLADISERLAKASRVEREKFEVSPSGYGIHWPLIDEDLSIDGLIGIEHKRSQTKESIPTSGS
jgi:hypothetical protein